MATETNEVLIRSDTVTENEELTWNTLKTKLHTDDEQLFAFYSNLSPGDLRKCFNWLKPDPEAKNQLRRLSAGVTKKIRGLEVPGCASWSLGVGAGAAAMGSYIYLGIWLIDNYGMFPAAFLFTPPPVVIMACLVVLLATGITMLSSTIGNCFNKELTELEELRDNIQAEIDPSNGLQI